MKKGVGWTVLLQIVVPGVLGTLAAAAVTPKAACYAVQQVWAAEKESVPDMVAAVSQIKKEVEDSGKGQQQQGDTGTQQGQEGPAGILQGQEGPAGILQGQEGPTGILQGQEGDIGTLDVAEETGHLVSELGLSDLDNYLQQEDFGGLTFSGLLQDFMEHGFTFDFPSAAKKIWQAATRDYRENRAVLVQILTLVIAFSVLMQMTSSIQKNYISNLGFLGIYLILMLLLLKLFLIMGGVAENFLTKLVEFMQVLQPVFCMSMVFSTGSISAGAYYQLLLLLIYFVDVIFSNILLPIVQVQFVLQLVNHMMEEVRFSRIAALLTDSIHWCVKLLTTAVIGLNIVQGLLAPGIDGLKRSTAASAVRAVPGVGQIMNSMTEILAGSAMLIKNSVGVAALVVLVMISFLPLVKLAVFMLLYRGLAALMEPVSDKRFCAAAAALGDSAGLYLKLLFYAVLLFFLTTAVICAATTLSV